MDPLTCLSIACSAMQIISFSHEICSLVKRIKEDGSVDQELREHIGYMSESSKSLGKYLEGIKGRQLESNQTKLEDIASKCLKTSLEIKAELDKVDNSRGGSIGRAVRLLWSKKAMVRLERAMQSYQHDMQTEILVHLW
jgi:hypothetical protein